MRGSRAIRFCFGCLGPALACLPGCQWFVNDADRQVYALVEKRELQSIGEAHPAPIGTPKVPIHVDKEAYAFVPHPVDSNVPESFQQTATQPALVAPATQPVLHIGTSQPAPVGAGGTGPESRGQDVSPSHWATRASATSRPAGILGAATTRPSSFSARPETQPAGVPPAVDGRGEPPGPVEHIGITPPPLQVADTQPATTTQPARQISLQDALALAFQNAREFQTAKEDLYLAALALTLERHLWTPRPFGNIETQYANYGQIRNFDHAMATVAQVGVTQKLPLGGEVTARVVDNLMRDLTHHITSAETGAMILEANVPLLRGAGLVALEVRFQAERNLIYAIRTFERFRQEFAVSIAGDYFNLQQAKQQIENTRLSIKSDDQLVAWARARWRTGWVNELDVQRAEQDRLRAISSEVSAVESYRSAMDRFKVRLTLPPETPLDVPLPEDSTAPTSQPASLNDMHSLEDSLRMPDVSEEEAIRVATKYRLDLLNSLDAIDDAARGVANAENSLLPSLDATGSVRLDTDPNRLGTFKYNTERATWRGSLNLELPLDRVAERNLLRNRLIAKDRAQRGYENDKDLVVVDVRRAMRRVQQQQTLLQIQTINRDLAIKRRRAAQIRFQMGQIGNRDIVEAENELLSARDALASAQAQLRLAILQFRRDTGTLRVNDDGKWYEPVACAAGNQ
jgi:outer membrane protein TolC